MPFPLHTPRVNNNDDEVRLVQLWVEPGAFVKAGAALADIETDKATVTVEAEKDGFVLQYCGTKGEMVRVGGVLAWMGVTADEQPPTAAKAASSRNGAGTHDVGRTPTLRAAMLIAQHGLDVSQIAASGDRITVEDVQQFLSSRPAPAAHPATRSAGPQDDDAPAEPGKQTALDPQRRGMLRAVSWQKRHAVPGYVETVYQDDVWTRYAAEYRARYKLMLSPLLALLAYRLVQVVKDKPALNATLVRGQHYAYDAVNLGFTVQSGDDLYAVVVRSAETMDEAAFVVRLGELQRAAMKKSLKPEETQGATIGFSSMARWQTTRHIPVLLPHTALMVAHAATREGGAAIGATYDHRVLTGADAILALQQLCKAT